MAELGSPKNIIVGAGAFFVGDAGTVLTESSVVKTGGLTGTSSILADPTERIGTSWNYVGFTTEGVELSFQPDFGEVAVDQLLDVAKIFKQGQQVMVSTTLSEATLENLYLALASGTETGTTAGVASGTNHTLTLDGGSLGQAPVERSICVVGPGPSEGVTLGSGQSVERVYVGYRAVSMDTVSVGVRRNEATVFAVNFRLLPGGGVGSDDNLYGKVIDRLVG
jgi:hypothetical protein